MRTAFPGFYEPDERDWDKLNKDAVIVFDACALLNLYDYSTVARSNILDALEALRERLWLPHQFGLEFLRNRRLVLQRHVRTYRGAQKAVEHSKNELKRGLTQQLASPFIRLEVKKALDETFERCAEDLRRQMDEHQALLAQDPVLERITRIYEGRIGPAPTPNEVAQLLSDGDARYKTRRPPGYMDFSKSVDSKHGHQYGDFFGWESLLRHCAERSSPAIIVSDDLTEDWWAIGEDRKILGPRPELISEFRERVDRPFHMYRLPIFLTAVLGRIGAALPSTVLDEAQLHDQDQQEKVAADDVPDADVNATPKESLAEGPDTETPKGARKSAKGRG